MRDNNQQSLVLSIASAGTILDQERLWAETLAEDTATEKETQCGGEVPTEINPQLMHDIQVLVVSRLVGKAHQLIKNFTTNLAENWMQIRCKFDGGKVINRSQSGSCESRCSGAGLQKNLGKCWGPPTWQKMTGFPASQVLMDTAESAKKADKDRKRKATEEAKDSRRRSKYSRNDNSIAARKAYSCHDNGIEPDDIINDVSPEYLEEMKTSFFNTRVTVTKEKSDDIERDTWQQRESELWMIERTKRITTSRVGGIVKMKKTTKRSRKLEEFLYSKFQGNEATSYGTNMEETARQHYNTYQQQRGHPGLRTQKVGLVISTENP